MSNTSLTAATYPIVLDAVTYQVSPLDDVAISALDNYVRSVHIESAVAGSANLQPALQSRVIDAAVRQASSLSALAPEGAAILKNPDGVAMILWLGIKRNHPDVAYETIRAKMFAPEAIRRANHVFNELNVKPLEEVAAKGKAQAVVASRRKKSTKRSPRSTR